VWTFAEYLRHERLSRNLTMENVAESLVISPQFVSLLEGARRHPSRGVVARCADLFEADRNYVGFLAQRMPIEQKRALAESPNAPDYIPRALRARAHMADGEEDLLRRLLLPRGTPLPERDAPYYAPDEHAPPDWDEAQARELIATIAAEPDGFSAKARAWAGFHDAYLVRVRAGRAAALPAWDALAAALQADTTHAYGPTIRHLVAMQRCLALRDIGREEDAEGLARSAAAHAGDGDDPDAVACALYAVADLRRSGADVLGAVDALTVACRPRDLPVAGRARCLTALADALAAADEHARARAVAEEAAPLLRTTALPIPRAERTGLLFRVQAVAALAMAELGDLDTATTWLTRARSVRPRAGSDPVADARLSVASGTTFLARGRPAMARRRVEPLLDSPDTDAHMRRRSLRVAGR
jgi:transcriptional regulator with XRE-family HTH domain